MELERPNLSINTELKGVTLSTSTSLGIDARILNLVDRSPSPTEIGRPTQTISPTEEAATPKGEKIPGVTFTVELPVIELGRIEVNERKDCYFTLVNNSNRKVLFTIENVIEEGDAFEKFPVSGELNASQTMRMDLWLRPNRNGDLLSLIFPLKPSLLMSLP